MISLKQIRTYLDKCENPLIFFDDDADGLSSFLLLYKYMNKGKGVLITHPVLDESYLQKVEQYHPDLILVLDKHGISQEFVDKINVPIIWVDHHPIEKLQGVKHFNPLYFNEQPYPTSYWCYEIVKENLWIAATGIISDHSLMHFKKFSNKYKDLVNNKVKEPFDAMFNTKIGILSKLFTFILKGKAKDVKRSLEILTKINDPYEILNKNTPRGKYIYERFERINRNYEKMLNDAIENSIITKDILLYTYTEAETSFTGVLSNELISKFKDKLIIVAREKNDSFKISIRNHYKSKTIIPKLLEKAVQGLKARCGGHDHACGGEVYKEDFKEFVDRLEHLLK